MSKIIIMSGSVAPLLAGLGIGQALHGHPWGYLLISVGLAATAPYFVLMARSWWLLSRRRRGGA
jgi:hypothetical protein